MKPKALVLLAQGTNRDHDVAEALNLAGADPDIIPLVDLREGRKSFGEYRILVLPGGFSYADALGAGRLLAIDLLSYFADEILRFVEAGNPVIGICNGFQSLVKAGILPGDQNTSHRGSRTRGKGTASRLENTGHRSTLTFNASGHFECRWVTLKAVSQKCIWTRGLEDLITCPVAHGEGNFQVSDSHLPSVLSSLDQIALTYICPDGTSPLGSYPANPNGSVADIAGLCNLAGNVLGLMPHPENHIYAWQNPQRRRGVDEGSGLSLFRNGVQYAEER